MIRFATRQEIETIKCAAYNECAREMARHGVRLTYEQADEIGDEGLVWLQSRLGLRVQETDSCVECKGGV